MPSLVRLQRFSEHFDSAKIVRWFVAEGDRVLAGDPLVEIECGKATLELEANETGRLAATLAAAGATVDVGAVIASIALDGEDSATIKAHAFATYPMASCLPAAPRRASLARLFGLRS